jgi:nucleoside-diphosphate-sugar epimerase
MSQRDKIFVTGAGGFIGHNLVTYLKRQGYWMRGVDLTSEGRGRERSLHVHLRGGEE